MQLFVLWMMLSLHLGFVLSISLYVLLDHIFLYFQCILTTIKEMTFESYKFSNKVFVKDTQQRIMLTLGSVAGKLSKNGRGQEAHEITQRIHEMLGMHGKIWKNHKLRE